MASPFTEYKKWILDKNNDHLNDDVKKVINNRFIISCMGNLGMTSVYLNKYLNNFDVMDLDQNDLSFFMKNISNELGMKWSDFSFYKSEKQDKKIKEIHNKFPYLKKYEVETLINNIKDESFKESIGVLKKPKKKKTTKKDKKRLEDLIDLEMEKDIVETDDLNNISTDKWFNKFNMTIKREDASIIQGGKYEE